MKFITRRVPWVTLKAALSADGRIAAAGGDARWITSAAARDYGHLLRGEHDAVLVGVGTLLRDDPRLTVRHRAWGRKPVTRIILDPRLRFPPTARILSTLREGPLVVLARRDADPARARLLRSKGVEVAGASAGPTVSTSPPFSPLSAAGRSPAFSSRAGAGSFPRFSRPAWPTKPSWHSRRSSSAAPARPGSGKDRERPGSGTRSTSGR
jgi:diaminohydroxyphosphoribosylaminopyrimidine deaminase/5-amino-6-(5-phosphoribosylamino)uracil reductase